ncbi:LacI family DNA-binding transcriptional regulator [Paenibacillus sp. J22TS3]|uniref:LacI family DNA-binding transcriptional regulator n=1 Tax=Paenibacillus sp. J22TS3 TaxID=2807192 RepID=UPI001B2F3FD5|nr:LacI family DNA-binding transcriptional regulator [Paenibacillus sp. J22TS3]GIP22486.1 LacI family transcriptional regulator [Paenibacillus sp. J22TS3]
MAEKVTIQDIANALGLSRNTVSKALNNHPQIPEQTRDKIIQKAADLKYKNYSKLKMGNIALLTRGDINTISFYSETIRGIETSLSANGYNLILTLVKPEDIRSGTLPANIHQSNLDGIISVEIFDKPYMQKVLNTGIPTVFIDSLPNSVFELHKYDVIMVENELSTYQLTQLLIEHGHQNIGFIGDAAHCRSFYERWLGFTRALSHSGLGDCSQFSIQLEDTNPYLSVDWMTSQIKALNQLPTAFVCANDDIAISVIRSLKSLGYNIPADIEVTGFDDIPNSAIIEPALTTVHTYPYELGKRVVESLLNRIDQPDRHNETVYLETSLVWRESTK